MEPDFKGFAQAWVGTDQRLADFVRDKPDAADSLVAKMAEALDRRRRKVQSEPKGGGDLIVNVGSDFFQGRKGLTSGAYDQLAQMIEEHDEKLKDS